MNKSQKNTSLKRIAQTSDECFQERVPEIKSNKKEKKTYIEIT